MQTPRRTKRIDLSTEKRRQVFRPKRTSFHQSPNRKLKISTQRIRPKQSSSNDKSLSNMRPAIKTRGLPSLALQKINTGSSTARNQSLNSARVKTGAEPKRSRLNMSDGYSSHLSLSTAQPSTIAPFRRQKPTREISQNSSNRQLAALLSPRDFPEPIKGPQELFNELTLPIRPGKALSMFKEHLTAYEQSEILDTKEIYYIGIGAHKIQGKVNSMNNNGYDDERNDYLLMVGDHIGYRYEIVSALGKGSFGQVIKAIDHKTKKEVALKIIRNQSRFHKQAAVEIRVLQHLKEHENGEDYNVVHIMDYFVFRRHIVSFIQCLTFELLSFNLYEFIKANNYKGISPNLIRRFAVQLLKTLAYFRRHQIIHCDLKPENILLRHPNKSEIKVIDLGSACFENEKVYNYIQSRFYRAPEIILGISYTGAIDMWSFGCILAELSIGFPLFPGQSEVEQLHMIMEVRGQPPQDVLDMGTRAHKFFLSNNHPLLVPDSRGKIRHPGTHPLQEKLKGADYKFIDLVERKFYIGCLEWNPEKRITPIEAVSHPWMQELISKQVTIVPQRGIQPKARSNISNDSLDKRKRAGRIVTHNITHDGSFRSFHKT